MSKFLLLYSGGEGMPETEEEIAAVEKAWGAWYGGLGSAVVDAGNPFAEAAKTVASNGTASDGVSGVMAKGYTILEAGSFDEAVKMAQGSPVLQGGADISLYEIVEMM